MGAPTQVIEEKHETLSVPTGFAHYPLTVFDSQQQNIHMTKGWIVEGAVDVEKIREALDRVVEKWRMLAGRLEVVGRQRYRIRVPLGKLPPGHKCYNLTSVDSEVPLSHYVSLPLPAFSNVLPHHLFFSDEVKRQGLTTLDSYAAKDAPFTHWHITRFTQKGQEYSCIGMVYNHGLFDGLGSGFIVKALEAELAGRPWAVPIPSQPTLGEHDNIFQKLMDAKEAESDAASSVGGAPTVDPATRFAGIGAGGLLQAIYVVLMILLGTLLYGAGHYCVIIPYKVHTRLAEEMREQAKEAGLTGARAGTGDVFFAWFMKTIYQDGSDPRRTIGFQSLATMRTEWDGQVKLYPHNCNFGQSLPVMTAGEVTQPPLYQVAYRFAKDRTETSRDEDCTAFWKLLKRIDAMRPFGFYLHCGVTDDTLTLSNVSMNRIADVDWSPAGGGRVLTNYIFGVTVIGTGPGLKMMTINGRLGNGDLVMNFWLSRPRGKLVEAAVKKLIEEYN